MKSITTYLHFNGNCRTAMAFYRECFGGKLDVMAYPDASGKPNTEPKAPVMHSESIGVKRKHQGQVLRYRNATLQDLTMCCAYWRIIPLLGLLLLSGCAGGGAQKPYGIPGSAVKPIGSDNHTYFNGEFEKASKSGQYIFDFDYDELGTFTDNERVGQYFLLKRLMPPYCQNGIRIISGGRGENGKAWLIFKCRE